MSSEILIVFFTFSENFDLLDSEISIVLEKFPAFFSKAYLYYYRCFKQEDS